MEYIHAGSEELLIYKVHHCHSTMDLAWELLSKDLFPCWASVIAGTQSSGRGQLGRNWYSSPGNLYGSLRLPSPRPQWRDLVSLVIARALWTAVKETGLKPAIKWPNDILVQGKKIAGILIEERSGSIIAGIGVNLLSAPGDDALHHVLSPRAGCLSEFGVDISPIEIWSSLVHNLRFQFESIMQKDSPDDFLQSIMPHMAYMGDRVLIDSYEDARQPVVLKKIDIRGGLIVQTAQGERTLMSGSLYPLV